MTKHKGFRFPDDFCEQLEAQAKATGKSETAILIDLWRAKDGDNLLKPSSEVNRYQFLDGACSFLAFLSEEEGERAGWHCVRTEGQKRFIGLKEENASKICEKCKARKQIKEVLIALQQGGSGTYYTCKLGGQISEFDTDQVQCPARTGTPWTKFTEYCKTNNPETKAQEPCPFLQDHYIQLKQVNRETISKKERR